MKSVPSLPLMLVAVACMSVLSGCTSRIAITLVSAKTVNELPSEAAIGPHASDLSPEAAAGGPFIAVTLATPVEVNALALRKQVHRVYYVVSTSDGTDLCSGRLYGSASTLAAPGSASAALGAENRRGFLYTIHVPTKVESLARCSSVVGTRTLASEIDRIRTATELQVRIRGGNSFGGGFESNSVGIPVVLNGGALREL